MQEIVLDIVQDSTKVMNIYSREKSTDEYQLKDFESRYREKPLISWYTCESFLYGMLSHAL